MENLYSVLEINQTADTEEIKKAYRRMVRKHPPEKDAEAFKKIQEAYERLVDPTSRAEYDAMAQYKDEIEAQDKIGADALKNEDYKTAINAYKKILLISPTLTYAKNRLALALAGNNQLNEAMIQLEELLVLNPKNGLFHSNLAFIYRELGRYTDAELEYLKARELDQINDNTVIGLVEMYIHQKKYSQATAFLQKCIDESSDNLFQRYLCYLKVIEIHIITGNKYSFNSTLKVIETSIPEDAEIREYVAWKFAKLACEVFEVELYEYSQNLSETVLKLTTDKTLTDTCVAIRDDSIKFKKINKEWERMYEDTDVLQGIKALVLVWLSSDLTDSERKSKNEMAVSMLEEKTEYQLYQCLKRVKTQYPTIYRNMDFLRNVFTELAKNYDYTPKSTSSSASSSSRSSSSSTSSSGRSSSSTSSSGYSSSSNSSSGYSNHSSSSSSNEEGTGCLFVIVGGIIGGILIPGIGFIIGAMIGNWLAKNR